MSAVVADTDVVSLIFKRHSLSGSYLDAIEGKSVVLSFMTLGELELWMLRRSWGAVRRKRLGKFLENFSIRHSDEPLCKTWASIRHQAFLAGKPVDVADAWIAATAMYLDVPLVTHNRRHFENIEGVELISVR